MRAVVKGVGEEGEGEKEAIVRASQGLTITTAVSTREGEAEACCCDDRN